MSELKTRFIDDTYAEYYKTGKHDLAQIYIKAEADKVIADKDKVIAELEERIDELQKATDSAWSKVNAMYDELRHQKYKQCLAMAKWCRDRWADIATPYVKSMWYYKWYNRWCKLADEFKEANK